MQLINNIVKFYKECYLNDYKGLSITNFLSPRVEYQFFPTSFEFLNGSFPEYPVDSEWGREVDEALILHSKEKALYAGSFFIKGSIKILGKPSKVFVPLYLHEITLIFSEDVYYISARNPIINPAFLQSIKAIDPSVSINYDALLTALPIELDDFQNLLLLQEQLHRIFPNLNIDSLESRFESNHIDVDLTKIYKQKATTNPMTLYSGIAIGLFQKPKGTRGVINELTAIADKDTIKSALLQELFIPSHSHSKRTKIQERIIHVPVSLSEAQKKVFYAVDNSSTTLVIGPPGTGKSFTIAALATELMSQGKSVLIASKNNQAGKVISDKIEKDFGLKGLLIKTARKTYKTSLITRLNNILNSIKSPLSKETLNLQKVNIDSLQKEIQALTLELINIEKKEIIWGKFYYESKGNLLSQVKALWFRYQKERQTPVWKINKEIDAKKLAINRHLKKYIKENFNSILYATLQERRKDFLILIDALNQEAGNLIHSKFKTIDFELILKALPVWVCNTSDISTILPLQENLFDVLIIDEATQCDIASTIPLLYRSKKVVIVGDPKQLRHYSFLSKFQQNALRDKFNIDSSIPDYRTNSILDLVNKVISSQEQVIFLDEHYRSAPDIIAFSNARFYSDNLKVMTASVETNVSDNVSIHLLAGERNENGQNLIEATAIIEAIKKIVDNEQNLSKKLSKSIGIISPFRAQVNLLKSLIRSSFDLANLKKHDVLIGTPYHFQGEERDVILLSFVVDNDSHPSILTYLNKEDVFNVSITRARNKQFLFTSINYPNLDQKHLLSQYLNSIGIEDSIEEKHPDIHDQFADEVITIIQSWDVDKILKFYPIAGVDIDIVIVKDNKTYCIDLIGYPGEFEEQFTPAHIQMLSRMKHAIFFIPYSSWYLDKNKVIANLKKFISK